jgi:hypothetical protein
MEQGLRAKTDEAKTLKAQKDELVATTEQLQESLTDTQTTLDTTQVSRSNKSVLLTVVDVFYTTGTVSGCLLDNSFEWHQ